MHNGGRNLSQTNSRKKPKSRKPKTKLPATPKKPSPHLSPLAITNSTLPTTLAEETPKKMIDISTSTNDTTKSFNLAQILSEENYDQFQLPAILFNSKTPETINYLNITNIEDIKEISIHQIPIKQNESNFIVPKTPSNWSTSRIIQKRSLSVNTYLKKSTMEENTFKRMDQPISTPTRGRKRPLYFKQRFVAVDDLSIRTPPELGIVTSVAKRVRSTPEVLKNSNLLKCGTPKRLFNSTPKEPWTPLSDHGLRNKDLELQPAGPISKNCFNQCVITQFTKQITPGGKNVIDMHPDSSQETNDSSSSSKGWFSNFTSKFRNFLRRGGSAYKNKSPDPYFKPNSENLHRTNAELKLKLEQKNKIIETLTNKLEESSDNVKELKKYIEEKNYNLEKRMEDRFLHQSQVLRSYLDKLDDKLAEQMQMQLRCLEKLDLFLSDKFFNSGKLQADNMANCSTISLPVPPPPPPPPPPTGVPNTAVERLKREKNPLRRSNTLPTNSCVPCITVADILGVKLRKPCARPAISKRHPQRTKDMKSEDIIKMITG